MANSPYIDIATSGIRFAGVCAFAKRSHIQ